MPRLGGCVSCEHGSNISTALTCGNQANPGPHHLPTDATAATLGKIFSPLLAFFLCRDRATASRCKSRCFSQYHLASQTGLMQCAQRIGPGVKDGATGRRFNCP